MPFHLELLYNSNLAPPGDKLSGEKFLPPHEAPYRELIQLHKINFFLLSYFTSISMNSMYRKYFAHCLSHNVE